MSKMDGSTYPELRSFESYGKTPRWFRDISISEKIDGTNACVLIDFVPGEKQPTYGGSHAKVQGALKGVAGTYYVRAGSRNKLVSPGDDNYAFGAWVYGNASELTMLGEGRHYGEWYGKGIGRNYGLQERRFALFNPTIVAPDCCEVVPQLYAGPAIMPDKQCAVTFWLRRLAYAGSEAVRGWKGAGKAGPEGVIVFHTASNSCFKATFENDAEGKGA